jgi:hypothetical protein
MATFPFDVRLRRFGVALALYPASNELAMEIQRAPDDGAGAPDTGSAEIIDVVAPGTRTYVDLTGGIKHYRIRHISASGETGDWTHWVGPVTATSIPSVLPNVPKLRDPSIAVEETVGSSSFSVTVTVTDPDRRIKGAAADIAFQTRTGVGAYGGTWLLTWDTDTGDEGVDAELVRTEAVSFGTTGRASLKFRVQWEDDSGELQERIEHVELSSENIIKSSNLRWVPVSDHTHLGAQISTYDLYLDVQLGADVASVHWEAERDDGPPIIVAEDDVDISADGEIYLLRAQQGDAVVFNFDDPPTVYVTPYDATGGEAGAGDPGPTIARLLEPYGETGSTGGRVAHSGSPSTVRFGDRVIFTGAGVTVGEDADGRPEIAINSALHLDVTSRATSGTGEDLLETITVPANALGTDGGVRLTCMFRRTGVAGDKTIKVKFGATTLVNEVYTNAGDLWLDFVIANNASASAQVALYRISSDNDTIRIDISTAAQDTTGALDITITGECADAGDSIDLRSDLAEYVNI